MFTIENSSSKKILFSNAEENENKKEEKEDDNDENFSDFETAKKLPKFFEYYLRENLGLCKKFFF